MKQMDTITAQKMIGQKRPGELELLDVRQEWEYSEMHLPGARLIPLGELPDRLNELDPDRPVLVYCRSGIRSHSAGQFLKGQGFAEIINLNGGLMGWQGVVSEGGPDSGMIHFPEIEAVDDVYRFGYGMERSLQGFYKTLAGKTESVENRDLFLTLASFEDKHMRQLYALYSQAVQAPISLDEFEALPDSGIGEGGFDPESYLTQLGHKTSDRQDIIELAMAIEAQALDYYMRCAFRSAPGDDADSFQRLAREEQGHLRMLTQMLDRMA
jgi:rhodanese-related sulfurtransferase/rubrerythrin